MASVYEVRPWLKNYPEWVPHDLEITPDTALSDFVNSATRKPEAPAVFYFDHVLSYGEIDRYSNSLSAAFRDLGVTRGDRIILVLQNVPQFLIAIYAAWKLGAIVVPLNPMYKEKELTYFCRDSEAKIFLTHEEVGRSLDLTFLKDTSVQKVITTSALDLLPKDVDLPKMLGGMKKERVPGTLDMLDLFESYRGKSIEPASLMPENVAYLTYTVLPKGR
jgi:long-chain acyl-CoA synthetase